MPAHEPPFLPPQIQPNFEAGRQRNPIALLQLACRELCVLVHVASLPAPHIFGSLQALLEDATVVKVGCGLSEDVAHLWQDFGVGAAPACPQPCVWWPMAPACGA